VINLVMISIIEDTWC